MRLSETKANFKDAIDFIKENFPQIILRVTFHPFKKIFQILNLIFKSGSSSHNVGIQFTHKRHFTVDHLSSTSTGEEYSLIAGLFCQPDYTGSGRFEVNFALVHLM